MFIKKKNYRHAIRAFALALFIWILISIVFQYASAAVSLNIGISGLTVKGDKTDGQYSTEWTYSQGTITGAIKGGGTCRSGNSGAASLSFTNTKGQAMKYEFTYIAAANYGGTVKIGDDILAQGLGEVNDDAHKAEKESTGSRAGTLANGSSLTIALATSTGSDSTARLAVSNIYFYLEGPFYVTFPSVTGGTYTAKYNSSNCAKDTQISNNSKYPYVLNATPSNGYSFFCWYKEDANGNKTVLSWDKSTSQYIEEDCRIYPHFISSTTTMWGVGGQNTNIFYEDLNDALSFAQQNNIQTVFLASSAGTISGSYEIPNKITLLIPMDGANTIYTTTPEVVYGSHAYPTAFRTLTMADGASINVQSGGAICLSGKLCATGQLGGWNGTPTGPDGRIKMETGSSITVQNGGNLYCWGYIYGSGSVEAKSGATVYEAYQIKDWRGGTATSNCYKYAFIFSQYYVQNIEVPLKLNAGATEKLYSSVNASSSAHTVGATLVGNGGLFNISSGYLVKDYIESTDRLQIDIYGDASVTTMSLTGLPMIGSISTDDYELPITNNITVNVHSGTTSITQDIKLLPGVEFNIDNGASATINSGKKVYVYDLDNWGNFTGSARLHVIGYSVANGTTAKRTAASLADASINVNGTLNVSGKLYTSEAGANITSSGKTGQIIFTAAPDNSNATIYEMANNSTQTAVTFNPARLHNGTSDPAYTPTAGAAKNTTFYYCTTCNPNGIWETEHTVTTYTVTWKSQDGKTTLKTDTFKAGEVPAYTGAVPEKASDRQYNYVFKGWAETENSTTWLNTLPAITDRDVSYFAVFEAQPIMYNITYVANNGTDAQTVKQVESGTLNALQTAADLGFEYSGYVFNGWFGSNGKFYTVENGICEEARFYEPVTLTAEWQEQSGTTHEVKTYTITWLDGHLIEYPDETKDITIRTDYVQAADSVTPPTARSYVGYSFKEWKIVDSAGNNVVSIPKYEDNNDYTTMMRSNIETWGNTHSDITGFEITAVYTADSDTCTVTAKAMHGNQEIGTIDGIPANLTIGDALRLNAPEINGYTFSHWKYGDKVIPSQTIRIWVNSTKIDLVACYVGEGETAKEQQLVYVSDTYSEIVNGVNKIAAALSYTVPDGATATNVGFFYSRVESEVQGDSFADLLAKQTKQKTAAAPGATYGTYTLHISSKSNTFKFFMRPFVIYTDSEGTTHEVLGDYVFVDWDEAKVR